MTNKGSDYLLNDELELFKKLEKAEQDYEQLTQELSKLRRQWTALQEYRSSLDPEYLVKRVKTVKQAIGNDGRRSDLILKLVDTPLETFEDSVEDILLENEGVLHIAELELQLHQKSIPIPGQGTRANIITRISRSPEKFIRIAVGTYAIHPITKIKRFPRIENEFKRADGLSLNDLIASDDFDRQVSWECEKHKVEYKTSLTRKLLGHGCGECTFEEMVKDGELSPE